MTYTALIFKDGVKAPVLRYEMGPDANLAAVLGQGVQIGVGRWGKHYCRVWCSTELFSFRVYPLLAGSATGWLRECYEAATEGRLPDVAKMPQGVEYVD